MKFLHEVEKILAREDISVPERRVQVFARLAAEPDRGISAALECLLRTDNRRVAAYLTQYFEFIPGAVEEKTRAADRLRHEPRLLSAVSRLVPWLPGAMIDELVSDYLARGDSVPALSDVVFVVGKYFPERLRPFAERIDDEYVQRALLSGAPDSKTESFLKDWRRSGDPRALIALAYARTERSREIIRSLRGEIEDSARWETLLELAGQLPDTGKPAGSWPAFRGFVSGREEGPHAVGGNTEGEVPVCHMCEAPAARLLELSAQSLPYEFANDPIFYWYSCDCGVMDSVTVRVDASGMHVFYGPKGVSDPGVSITPGELSLVLERHPNQTGISLREMPGNAGHQVGGLPAWRDPDIHPRCPDCGNSMPYAATMDCGRTPFGDMNYDGIIYCFWCDGCRVSCTQIQH
ncbi:hypothetical protein IQ279_09885 [Streptomyces verrucosisporus]|uniref:hypothetical protein n=1 Tax=Streptomyces verrucosisporus TaxID=1695161 RepID=UPI0019D21F05|nr:hypothetical protein [Streptomyces verrucosisporus]MBN3929946.1 hypothetical protein [Streptomyces verrucosisporus]